MKDPSQHGDDDTDRHVEDLNRPPRRQRGQEPPRIRPMEVPVAVVAQ
jgi:hypothetical protein